MHYNDESNPVFVDGRTLFVANVSRHDEKTNLMHVNIDNIDYFMYYDRRKNIVTSYVAQRVLTHRLHNRTLTQQRNADALVEFINQLNRFSTNKRASQPGEIIKRLKKGDYSFFESLLYDVKHVETFGKYVRVICQKDGEMSDILLSPTKANARETSIQTRFELQEVEETKSIVYLNPLKKLFSNFSAPTLP